jgi:hypothetical protein
LVSAYSIRSELIVKKYTPGKKGIANDAAFLAIISF